MAESNHNGAGAKIFISYAHADREKVDQLYNRLLEAGHSPWMDNEDILGGVLWRAAIEKAIQDSDFFLACLSENSVNRKGVIQEELKQGMDILNRMNETAIYLIPVKLDDCKVPKKLSGRQCTDLTSENGWEKLLKTLEHPKEKPEPRRQIEKATLFLMVPFLSLASKEMDHHFLEGIRGEVTQANPVVSINRPGSGWDVFLYYALYYFIAAAVLWLILSYFLRYKKHGAYTLTHKLLTAFKVTAVGVTVVLVGFLLSIFLLEPRVGPITDISGVGDDPTRSYYLFVRPVGSDRCWLQSPIPLLPSQDRRWNTTAFFGGAKGQRFEIIAIASKQPLHSPPTAGADMQHIFNKPDSYYCNLIPSDVERYVRVVVIK